MDLFKLVGTIVVNNANANSAITETTTKARKAKDTLSGTLSETTSQSKKTNRSLSTTFTNIGRGLTNTGTKLSSIGTGITETGTKLSHLTKPALVAGTALAGVVMKKGWSRMVELDNAKVKLKAIGLNAKDVSKVMENALTSVRGTSYGLDEAAATAASAVAAGIKPGKELEKYLIAVADAASVAGVDMGEMGAIFNKVAAKGKAQNDVLGQMAERGIPIYQYLAETIGCTAEEVFDMAMKGEIDLATFQKAVETHIGGASQTIGDQTITGTMANIGASISRIGQNFLGSADDADSFAGRVLPLLKDFKDWLGTVEEKAKEWGAVFGEVFSAVVTYVRSGGESFGTLSSSAQNVFDRLKPIIDILIGIANAFLSLSPKMQGAFVAGVLSAGPLLKLLGSILSVTGGLVTGIGKIITAAGKFSSAISGVLSIGSKLLSGVGKLILHIPKLLGVIQTAGTGFIKLFSIMAAHPIALIIAAIAALVAGFVYLWNHCEGFRQFWINLWENVKEVAITVWNAIRDFFSAVWQGIKSVAETIWTGIKDFFSGLWDGIKSAAETVWNALSGFLSTIWNGIKSTAETIWNGIKYVLSIVMDGIKTAISTAWNTIKSIITTILNGIKSVVSTIWNGIKTTITTVINGIKSFISNAWATIKTIITTALNGIKSVVSSIWGGIKTVISNVLGGIKTVVKNAWNGIKDTIAGILNTIKSKVSAIWDSIKTKVSSISDAIKTKISTVWSGIHSKISTILDGIKTTFSKIWGGIKDFVERIIGGIKNTIGNGIRGAKDIATGALNGIKSAFSNIFGGCVSIVRNVVDKIKGLFNFNWSLPRIKLPHFSINGKFSLNPPQVPYLGVEWYKKGAVLTEPTVFGMNPATGKAMAGGEAGAEAVAPIDTLMEYVRTAVQGENEKMIALLQKILEVLLAILGKDTSLYLDGKEISKIVNKYLGVEY